MKKYRVEWKEKGPNKKQQTYETDDMENFDEFVCEELFESIYAYDFDYVFVYAADPPKKKK